MSQTNLSVHYRQLQSQEMEAFVHSCFDPVCEGVERSMFPAHIPPITPGISLTHDQTISFILTSVAMDEIDLSPILHAESAENEQLSFVLRTLPSMTALSSPLRSDFLQDSHLTDPATGGTETTGETEATSLASNQTYLDDMASRTVTLPNPYSGNLTITKLQ